MRSPSITKAIPVITNGTAVVRILIHSERTMAVTTEPRAPGTGAARRGARQVRVRRSRCRG